MTTATQTDQQELVQIATTIKQQIGIGALMGLGASKFQAMSSDEENRGGLRMKVNPNRRLQYVEVALTWMDTYTVTWFKIKRNTLERVELFTMDNVYCDQLSTLLWDNVKP